MSIKTAQRAAAIDTDAPLSTTADSEANSNNSTRTDSVKQILTVTQDAVSTTLVKENTTSVMLYSIYQSSKGY